VWYRIVGDHEEGGKMPLLVLHGGPGAPHDYLEPLEVMASRGRRVIFYDQVGCGNSDQPHDPSLWTVDLFLAELGVIRRGLGLEHVHLLGHSWGGMLAMQYALTHPAGLRSLTIASSPASVPHYLAEARRLRAALPPEVQHTLTLHEEADTTDAPAYAEATLVFMRHHFCRLDPWPDCLLRTGAKMNANPEVYRTLWGPSEFHATGPLKEWDIGARLGEIQVPTLVTSGRYDEVTPAASEAVRNAIPGSQWVLFDHSAHMAHIEEAAQYLHVLDDFLTQNEVPA